MWPRPLLALAAAAAALAACSTVSASQPSAPPSDPQALVDARRGGMAMSVYALGAISNGVEKQAPARSYRLAAEGLAHFAEALPALFDARTAAIGGTQARPEVFGDAEGFAQRVAQYREATAALRDAVAAEDGDRIASALASTKAACKACHDSYRAER